MEALANLKLRLTTMTEQEHITERTEFLKRHRAAEIAGTPRSERRFLNVMTAYDEGMGYDSHRLSLDTMRSADMYRVIHIERIDQSFLWDRGYTAETAVAEIADLQRVLDSQDIQRAYRAPQRKVIYHNIKVLQDFVNSL